MYGWMCTLRAGICVCRSLTEKNTRAVGTGRAVFGTVTPRCSLLLYKLTSGVILWPFIYFRGLLLL